MTTRYRFTVSVERDDHSKIDATGLYEHQTDSQENTNAAGLPANAGLVAGLMEQWKKGCQRAVSTSSRVSDQRSAKSLWC